MRFPLRIKDEGLWSRFAEWCEQHDVSMNTGLLMLVKAAVEGRVTIGARRA